MQQHVILTSFYHARAGKARIEYEKAARLGGAAAHGTSPYRHRVEGGDACAKARPVPLRPQYGGLPQDRENGGLYLLYHGCLLPEYDRRGQSRRR